MNSVGAETFALFFFSSCSSRKGRLLHGVMKIDEIKIRTPVPRQEGGGLLMVRIERWLHWSCLGCS